MTAPVPPRRRRGTTIALTCSLAVCLVLSIGIVAGIVHLVRRDREPAIALEAVELAGFTTVVPTDWADEETTLEGAEILLHRASDDGRQVITIARLEVESTAEELCDTLQDSAEEQGLTGGYSRTLDPIEIDGRPAQVRTWAVQEESGTWSRGDLLCTDGRGGDGPLFLLAENTNEGETARRLPVLEEMLESWRWTD